MKTLTIFVLLVGILSLPLAAGEPGCKGCGPNADVAAKTAEAVHLEAIPGTNEKVMVGRIENLIPIGVVMVLGCEKCAEQAVGWALQQGSSVEDVDRTLRTVAAMQKLGCFQQQFGADAAGRLEKPLAAARHALEQAATRATQR